MVKYAANTCLYQSLHALHLETQLSAVTIVKICISYITYTKQLTVSCAMEIITISYTVQLDYKLTLACTDSRAFHRFFERLLETHALFVCLLYLHKNA